MHNSYGSQELYYDKDKQVFVIKWSSSVRGEIFEMGKGILNNTLTCKGQIKQTLAE